MREATIERNTAETQVSVSLELDGSGTSSVDTGIPFLDHMLQLFAYHGCFDLQATCRGDLEVDGHHSTEDIAIALGRAFGEALGDRAGICRYGDVILPMDEALVMVAVDISGRAFCSCELEVPAEQLGNFETELAPEFMAAFSRELGCSLHIRKLAGDNSHHIIEAAYKGLGRVMRQAVSFDPVRSDAIPSTKGSAICSVSRAPGPLSVPGSGSLLMRARSKPQMPWSSQA